MSGEDGTREPVGREPAGHDSVGRESAGDGAGAHSQLIRAAAVRSLERGYRRLLAWYPARHRREHGEEMLGVLLAASREGQLRPRPGEAVNLIQGALRIRLRRAPAEERLATWRDALALFSLIAPLVVFLLTEGVPIFDHSLGGAAYESSAAWFALQLLYGQLPLVILVLLRLRRTAAVLVFAYAGLYTAFAAGAGTFTEPGTAFLLMITLCEVGALAVSPGPRRGLELIRGRWSLLIPVAGVAQAILLASSAGFWPPYTTVSGAVSAPALAVLAVLLGGLAVASPLSRCLLLLCAIPGVPLAIAIISGWSGLDMARVARNPPDFYVAGLYCAPVLVTALIIAAARYGRRPAAGGAR